MGTELRIVFPEGSAAERARLATKLQDSLRNVQDLKTSVLREREDTQDPGTILSIVLAGPAVVLAVRAIAAWLVRNNQSSVTIMRPDGNIVLKNMRSEDVSDAITALEKVVSH